MMNFVLKMMNFVFCIKMMDFAFKMIDCLIKNDEFCIKDDEDSGTSIWYVLSDNTYNSKNLILLSDL